MIYTSGLVVTFRDDPEQAKTSLRELGSAGPFLVGEERGLRCAMVLEAESPGTAHNWHDWAASLPGVEGVEVVFVHWDEETKP